MSNARLINASAHGLFVAKIVTKIVGDCKT